MCKGKRLKGFEAIKGVHLVAEHFRCVCLCVSVWGWGLVCRG